MVALETTLTLEALQVVVVVVQAQRGQVGRLELELLAQ
jgi:hypothetical protein